MEENRIQLEQFEDRSIFLSMYNDIDWGNEGNIEICLLKSSDVAACARRFPEGHVSFLGPGTEEQWYGTHIHKSNGLWNDVAEQMMIIFRESGTPFVQEYL